MAELKQTSQQKSKLNQHPSGKPVPAPVHQESETDSPTYLIGATPIQPPVQKHALLLSKTPSIDGQADILRQLQKSYGNVYVQRLVSSQISQSPSDTKVQRLWNPFKKKPQISQPTKLVKTTSPEQIIQAIKTSDPRGMAAMLQNPGFMKQMKDGLSQPDYDEYYEYLKLGAEIWVWEMRRKIQSSPIPSVNEWVLFKQTAPEAEYKAAIQDFDSYKGPAAEKETFLNSIPPEKLYLFTDLLARQQRKPEDKTLEEQIKTSANPKRADAALKELKTKQAADAKSQSRLVEPIIELLVWGVAKPRAVGDLGSEGIIGIDQAAFAADALIAMSLPNYLGIIMKLDLTGGDKTAWDQRQTESVLILKAVAARKSKYLLDDAVAKKDVGEFAGNIRGKDLEKLTQSTSVRDTGGGTGLQQKFTMTCGPTSIQIMLGETDPVYAMDISTKGKHNLDYKSSVGKEQKKLLARGEKNTIPRLVKDDWDKFKQKINGLALTDADVPKWAALMNYIQGNPADNILLGQGKALAIKFGISEARLTEFKNYFPFNQPGWTVDTIATTGRDVADIPGLTNRTFVKQDVSPLTQVHLDTLWAALFRGRDVPMVVLWNGGGGHYMVFTDCKGDPPKGGTAPKYLLSDPWKGESNWLTAAQLLAGDVGIGHGRIVTFYM